ncbi:MAG: chorismate mutase [Firmicutes bacterium HGW-Firmicutes-7]|nr:MAG: chorismate mutase [Firmicutes bacterium HGW-Firmicutes-7]
MISVRGAIVIKDNTKESILSGTKRALEQIIKENDIQIDEIISIIFSATRDLTASYPAPVARELGIINASLLCVQEMYVENSMAMCIRILMNVNKANKANKACCQKDVKHIYLNGAESLRPDLNDK